MKRQDKKDKRRDVVLVIVEGLSDEIALQSPLSQAFEKKYGENTIVLFPKLRNNEDELDGGDITSLFGSNPEKIQMLMNKLIIMPYLKENHLMPKYVSEIIQIIDMDGAFIPDTQITLNNEAVSPIYLDKTIEAKIPQNIINRNKAKRDNIEALLQFQRDGFNIRNYHDNIIYGNQPTTKAFNVPYSVFYFSCNLDHFLHSNANLGRFFKVKEANSFARKYSNLHSFTEFLLSDPNAIKNISSEESWDFIKEGTQSLTRATNLYLLFESINND